MKIYIYRRLFLLLCCACSVIATAQTNHAQHTTNKIELGTSSAVDAQGRWWVASKAARGGDKNSDTIVLEMSTDAGQTWSMPTPIDTINEAIAADGESRPKIAFGSKGELFIAYNKPLAKPYTGDIRFVRSLDGGVHFSTPVTVHANRDLITHRFESMILDASGRIYIAWIDKRDAEAARARKEKYAGAAIYYAVSDDAGASFQGDFKLAEHSCECCRIALALNPAGMPVAMWRHVFAPNVRDHGMATFSADGVAQPMTRVTFDDWRIDACPHHGPALAFADDGTRHQTWFNVKGEQGGVFYAAASPDGVLGKPIRLGSAQAEHADVMVQGRQIILVWKQFNGTATSMFSRASLDGGASWQEREIASTKGHSDQPHLLRTSTGIALQWRTLHEGLRLKLIESEKW